MQMYAEPRVLTARPSEEDMHRVPHLLYGHVSVTEPYSVGRYQADAARALDEVRGWKRTPIFVGGTGMYFGVLTEGIADIPPVPAEVRARVATRRKEIGAAMFHAELAARDPEGAARLRASDTQRMLRAYEVFEATGRSLSQWQRETGKPVLAGLKMARFVLAPQREDLYARVDARFDRMIADGALEEAKALASLDPALPSAKLLGLRELLAVNAGTMPLAEAKAAAKQATRNYAKRQLTWFRNRMADWMWVGAPSISPLSWPGLTGPPSEGASAPQ
jgi:tRNA dimethylallyltransferase